MDRRTGNTQTLTRAAAMEHGACESVNKQLQMETTIKTEVEAAATSTAHIDIETDLDHLKQEPEFVQSVKNEPALLVKEEILENSSQEVNDQKCVQGASTPAGTGSLNEACNLSPSELLNVKNELADIDIGPTMLQHMDIHYTINKTMSAVTEEFPILDDCNEAMPSSGVNKQSIEDKLRGYLTPQNTTMSDQSACSMLQNLQLTVLKDQLESICRVHLMRLDTFQCDLCDVVYTEKCRLLQHLQSMHESRPQTSLFVKFNKINKQRGAAVDKTIPCKYYDQKVTEDDNAETNKKFCRGQQKHLQQHCLRQHHRNSSNSFRCDRTISKPHLLCVYNKLHQRNSRKIFMRTSSVVTASSDTRGDETAKIKQKPDVRAKEYSSKATKFAESGSFTKQINVLTGEKPYPCDACDARFATKATLVQHVRVHTGEKPYLCDICNARFSQSGTLLQHVRIHTGEKPYQCDRCDARFAQSGHLYRHIRVHTGEKLYRCDTCDARFAQNYQLLLHIGVTGAKPHRCDTCDLRFTYKCHLADHIRVHTGEKPYRCNTCDARFAHRSSLGRHLKYHTGEKPYQCGTCDKRFAMKNALVEHIRVHTGEKPYRCDMCDVRFAHSAALYRHVRVHTALPV